MERIAYLNLEIGKDTQHEKMLEKQNIKLHCNHSTHKNHMVYSNDYPQLNFIIDLLKDC